jgi:hypothetical protein
MKHQWLYLNTLDTVSTLETLVTFYVDEHNTQLPHSAFSGQTPDEMYFGTGNDIPAELEAARIKARKSRIEANRSTMRPNTHHRSELPTFRWPSACCNLLSSISKMPKLRCRWSRGLGVPDSRRDGRPSLVRRLLLDTYVFRGSACWQRASTASLMCSGSDGHASIRWRRGASSGVVSCPSVPSECSQYAAEHSQKK